MLQLLKYENQINVGTNVRVGRGIKMRHKQIEKFSVWLIDLPPQPISVKDESGRVITTTGAEMHSARPCVVVATTEDGRMATVLPLTSATDSKGGEKFFNVKKEWLRIVHEGKPSYILLDQIRAADRGRFIRREQPLGEYNRKQLEHRMKFVFQLV